MSRRWSRRCARAGSPAPPSTFSRPSRCRPTVRSGICRTPFILPHLGGYTSEYEELIMPLIVENMRLFLAGRQSEMQNIVAR